MKGQQRLYVPPEPPTRPCVHCDSEATHEASWRRAAWTQKQDLCEVHAKAAVQLEDRPHHLARLAPLPKVKPAPAAQLPLDSHETVTP